VEMKDRSGDVLRKVLIENLFYLYVVQIANYVLPFITFPFLVRMLGPKNFGLMAFVFAFIYYFVVIVDYGFNLTATKQIAVNRSDPAKILKIFNEVLFVKTLLMFICGIVVALLVLLIPKLHENWFLYSIAFGAVIGNVLLPQWFYQGIEKMKYIALFNLSGKVLSTLGIFVFIRGESDYRLAIIIQVCGIIIPGIVSMVHCVTKYQIKLQIPTVREIKDQLIDGWHVFVSQISMIIYSNSPIITLGMFASYQIVGYYSIAQKIISAAVNVCNPISAALFPRVGLLFHTAKLQALMLLRKVLFVGLVAFVLLSIGLWAASDYLVLLIAGERLPEVSSLIKIMSLMPLMVFIDNIFGTQILLNIGHKNKYMRALLSGSIVSMILSFIVIPYWNLNGAAIVVISTEMVIMFMMVIPAHRLGYSISNLFAAHKQYAKTF